MKDPIAKLIPLLARGIAPTAAVASGLLSPPALGAPGDLDPAFADVGRLGPLFGFSGPIWSLEPLANDEMFFGGGNFDEGCGDWGGWYCYYEFDASGFFGKLSTQGVVDPAYDAASLENTEVRDVVLQPDGKAIAVGRTVTESNFHSVMAVFRLNANGSLDQSFGIAGMARLPTGTDELGNGSAVSLDPDGRIVVAGYRNGDLAIVRLLPNGSLDSTFGVAGVFAGPSVYSADVRTQILRTASGAYRVATDLSDPRDSVPSPCKIVGLTVSGALDTSFGTSGIVDLSTVSGPNSYCSSAISQSDGRLLVAGAAESGAFVTRLQASGVADPSFATDSVGDTMNVATALALGQNGAVLVAGRGDGVTGALVARLQADGELDVLFGNSGSTQIDLDRNWLSTPIVHEMTVLPNGRVMVAGADHAFGPERPFVVRLVGEAGAGPGVVSAAQALIEANEERQQAVVTLNRTGGSAGNISVAYRTLTDLIPDATPGQDFAPVSGRLDWADGDASERRITVPLVADSATATPEEFEYFQLELSDVRGGAGFGTRITQVQIAPDGAPAGQFAIEAYGSFDESSGFVRAYVYRNYYSEGAVSVTVTPIAGTATAAEDFVATPVTLSWSDGDSNAQWIDIAITDDSTAEPFETFNLQLSNPTGGAIIGPRSVSTATILASDQRVPPQPQPPPAPTNQSRRDGGGSLGYLSVLLLGVAGFLRAVRRKVLRNW